MLKITDNTNAGDILDYYYDKLSNLKTYIGRKQPVDVDGERTAINCSVIIHAVSDGFRQIKARINGDLEDYLNKFVREWEKTALKFIDSSDLRSLSSMINSYLVFKIMPSDEWFGKWQEVFEGKLETNEYDKNPRELVSSVCTLARLHERGMGIDDELLGKIKDKLFSQTISENEIKTLSQVQFIVKEFYAKETASDIVNKPETPASAAVTGEVSHGHRPQTVDYGIDKVAEYEAKYGVTNHR